MEECTKKWLWMADYCKKMYWNPCDAYFWKQAEIAYCSQESTDGK